jgi:hypothetical protein
MGKAERNRNLAARERIAAQQAAAKRAEQRRRMLIAGGSVAVVLVLVVAIIVAKPGQTPARPGPTIADPALAALVTGVPPAAYDSVGKGTAAGLKTFTGPELRHDGKPEVLYIGGEFCPYCAAERWAIAAAMSRFGRLSGLHFIRSSPDDIYPSTPTLSFYRSGYASKYVSFVPVEWYGQAADPSTPLGHVYLQQPTAQEAALFTSKYNGANGIPFLDIANRYALPGVSYLPSALAGLSWSQVAHDMHDPASSVAQDIDGAANIISAAICKVTDGQPGGVCRSAGVAKSSGSI